MIDKTRLLAGRYRLIEQIDAGGTAVIYRARDEMTSQIVAVKILKPELTKNDEFVQRFKKEVQASLKLRHANIIRAYDAGLDNGMYYIVMDLIEGKTLKHLININGPLPTKYVVNIAKKLCLALEYAHVKGFVHRDIKPHNVLIDMSGEPFIADFGIAKNLAQNTITMEDNSVMGSVHYFSPEQAKGERADRRSDIYSLGILMYEMVTGRVPFDADTSVAIALKHINEPMPEARDENPGIPESLNRIILKAAQKDKHFRYRTAFTVYEDLQRCLSEPRGEYVKYTESKRTQQRVEEMHIKRSRRSVNRVFLSVGIGVGVVAAVIIVLSLLLSETAARVSPVPDVVGYNISKAIELLSDKGFIVKRQDVNDNSEKGTVIDQDPKSTSKLEEGSTVNLVVSLGAGAESMPSVTGMPQQQAETLLSQAGIEVDNIVKEPEGDMPIGTVLRQSPEAGADISPDVTVTLYVKISPDQKKIKMPDVSGRELKNALVEIQDSGFYGGKFFVIEEKSVMPPGNVIRQEPAADTEHLQDDPIYLYVSKPEGNEYTYEDKFNIDIPKDQTTVIVSIADELEGIPVFYAASSRVYPQGTQVIELAQAIFTFDSSEAVLKKNLVIFVDGRQEISKPVELKKVD